MLEGGYIQDYLNEFHGIVDMLVSVEIELEDGIQALFSLYSLPNSWNDLVMTISNSISKKGTLKFEDVMSVVLSEDIHHKRIGEVTSILEVDPSLGLRGKQIFGIMEKGDIIREISMRGWLIYVKGMLRNQRKMLLVIFFRMLLFFFCLMLMNLGC